MLVNLVLACVPLTVPGDRAFPTPVILGEALTGEFQGHGDFDNDGDDDLLHYTGNVVAWSGVRLFLNDGSGAFTPGPLTTFGFPASYTSGTLQPRVGDFDGDGNLDFVINRDGGGIAVGEGLEFFLGDGAGDFPTRILLPFPNPAWIRVGNMDGDAASELLVHHGDANFDRFLLWVDFQGGVPVALPGLQTGVPGVPNVLVFDVLDVDGDGIDDAAATGTTLVAHDTVAFFPTVAGTPTLGAQFAMPAEMQNINHRIHAGDLDGDGDDDLLVLKMYTSDPGPWVQAYEHTASGWTQRAAESVSSPTTGWFQPHDARLADWNGDGWLDVLSGGGSTDVLRSDGDWTFSEGFEAPATGQRFGGGTFDVDGDGFTDHVAGQTILFGNGEFSSFAVESGTTINFPSGAFVLDAEGDGDLDLVGGGAGQFAINDASGALTSILGIPFTQPLFPALPSPLQWNAAMGYADYDGDGRREYLVGFSQFLGTLPFGTFVPIGVARIPEDGKGGYSPAISVTAWGDIIPEPPFSSDDPYWSSGDADNDGDLDVLMIDGYRRNDGTGRFDEFVSAWVGRGRGVADLDGNGFGDILITRGVGSTTQLWVHYESATGSTATFIATVPDDAQALLRDLDADGDLDLLAADVDEHGLRLFENIGGSFAVPTVFPDAIVPSLRTLGVADVTGDGIVDLAMQRGLPGGLSTFLPTIAVFRGTGAGLNFELLSEHLTISGIQGFADLDSDGDFDAFGSTLLRGTLVDGLSGGTLHQAGQGVAGTGGFAPVLGATGPVLLTSSADQLRLVHARGGSNVILVFGTQSTTLIDQPLPGLVQYVVAPIAFPVLPLTGAAGAAGAGTLTFALPNLPVLAGLRFVHQAFVLDPAAPAGWSASNGLAITYGL